MRGIVGVLLGLWLAGGAEAGGGFEAQGKPAASPSVTVQDARQKYEAKVEALAAELVAAIEKSKEEARAEAGSNPDRAHRQILDLDKQLESLRERGEWPAAVNLPERKLWFEGRDVDGMQVAFRLAKASAVGTDRFEQLNAELAEFNSTDDLAPWQNLYRWCVPGEGRQAWSKNADTFMSPLASAGGGTCPIGFQREFPAEYRARIVVRRKGTSTIKLGFPTSDGRAAQVELAGQGAAETDDLRIALEVLSTRVVVAVNGSEVFRCQAGDELPGGEENLGICLAASGRETTLTVLSGELKCLARFGKAKTERVEAPKAHPIPDPQELGNASSATRALFSAVDWLVRHQGEDGGWSTAGFVQRCAGRVCTMTSQLASNAAPPATKATGAYDVGITGLATRALIRAWDQLARSAHKNPGDEFEDHGIGQAARAGIAWLNSQQNAEGAFTAGDTFLYNEAIAAQALVEAHRVLGTEETRASAERALQFLQAAQRPSPDGSGLWGWRYQSRQAVVGASFESEGERMRAIYESDTSVTGWCVAALQAGRGAGLQVEKGSMDGAVAFAKWCTGNDGLVGYIDPKNAGLTVQGPGDDRYDYHPTSMSALGMCIRLACQHDSKDPFLGAAAQRILSDLPTVDKERRKVDYYYWHEAIQALSAWDGPLAGKDGRHGFAAFSKAATDALVKTQDHTSAACSRGAWLIADRWAYASAGPVYATAINALTLEDALGYR